MANPKNKSRLTRQATVSDYLTAAGMWLTQAYPGNGGTDWDAWLAAAQTKNDKRSKGAKPFSGGSFSGGGVGGIFTPYKDYSNYKTFNEAFDAAYNAGEEGFMYGGKSYNTIKENNPIRELNNRQVGSSNFRSTLKKNDPYQHTVGPFKLGGLDSKAFRIPTGAPKKRPKAWIGAAIGAATSIAGGLLGASSQQKQARAAARQQAYQNALQSGASYASMLNSIDDDYTKYNMVAANGAVLKNGGTKITDGGVGIPLDDNTTLLQGGLHSQVNESGNTGIGLNISGKEIEAENNEVVWKTKKGTVIFSNQPMYADGSSPADRVRAGGNKAKIAKEQEAYKRILGIPSPSDYASFGLRSNYKLTGEDEPFYRENELLKFKGLEANQRDSKVYTSPLFTDGLINRYTSKTQDPNSDIDITNLNAAKVKANRANKVKFDYNFPYEKYDENPDFIFNNSTDDSSKSNYKPMNTNTTKTKSKFNLSPNTTAALIQGGGALLSGLLTNAMLNKTRYASAPPVLFAPSYKTDYNVNPQIEEIRRAIQQNLDEIRNNRSSSAAINSSINTLLNNGSGEINKLNAEKENKQTELINQALDKQVDVARENIKNTIDTDRFNTEIRNQKTNAQIENLQNTIQGIGDAYNFKRQLDRQDFQDNLSLMAPIMQSKLYNGTLSPFSKLMPYNKQWQDFINNADSMLSKANTGQSKSFDMSWMKNPNGVYVDKDGNYKINVPALNTQLLNTSLFRFGNGIVRQ